MESTLASSTATLSFPIRLSCAAKAFAPPLLPFCLPIPSRYPFLLHSSNSFASLGYLCSVLPVARSPFACISNSPSLFAYGGGGGTDGGGGSEGVDSNKSADAAEDRSDVSALSPDLIVLHVGGMTCGGCAASVKRILESQKMESLKTAAWEKETRAAAVAAEEETEAAVTGEKDLNVAAGTEEEEEEDVKAAAVTEEEEIEAARVTAEEEMNSGNKNPRSYFKCIQPICPAKKEVESKFTQQIAQIIEISYKGKHNQPKPQPLERSTSGSQGQRVASKWAGQNRRGNVGAVT